MTRAAAATAAAFAAAATAAAFAAAAAFAFAAAAFAAAAAAATLVNGHVKAVLVDVTVIIQRGFFTCACLVVTGHWRHVGCKVGAAQ